MSPSHRPSLRGPRSVPPLSAIEHGSHPVSFDDGLFLPSSCHGRTWLLDSVEETHSCGRVPSLEPEPCPQDSGEPGACLPGAVHMASSHTSARERTLCRSGGSPAEFRSESQACTSASSQPVGFAIQNCPPGSHGAKPCPPRTHESKKCLEPECGPSQGHPLGPVTPSLQLLGPSSHAGEPTCCVTGGW